MNQVDFLLKGIKCPTCGRVDDVEIVGTGCESNGKPRHMYKVRCPHCGQMQWVHNVETA